MLIITRKVGSSVEIIDRATGRTLVKIHVNQAQGDNRQGTGWVKLGFECDRDEIEVWRGDDPRPG